MRLALQLRRDVLGHVGDRLDGDHDAEEHVEQRVEDPRFSVGVRSPSTSLRKTTSAELVTIDAATKSLKTVIQFDVLRAARDGGGRPSLNASTPISM